MELAENFALLIKGGAVAAGVVHILCTAFYLQRTAAEVASR